MGEKEGKRNHHEQSGLGLGREMLMEWLWRRPVAIFQVILVEVKEGGWRILIGHQQPARLLIMPMINANGREDQRQGIQLIGFVIRYRNKIRFPEVSKIHVAGIS